MLLLLYVVGCNLAKNVVIQNCVCKLFDVGGSMQDLWPQYYLDADCVVFVIPNNDNERSDVELLEDVRRQIPDDVPFLIFVHDMNNEASSSFHHNHQQLLPNYHSNLMQIHHGNAKTGQGVRDAFEWLIQCAKRQAQLKNTTTSTK
jgi:GTPase SAR1 family protein